MADIRALNNLYPSAPEDEESSWLRRNVADPANALFRGTAQLGNAAVGLTRMVPGIGHAIDDSGYDELYQAGDEVTRGWYSPETRRSQAAAEAAVDPYADGLTRFGQKLGGLAQNPRALTMTAIESAPMMTPGWVAASKYATAAKAAGVAEDVIAANALKIASAAEGAVTAGSVAGEIASRNPDEFAARYWGIPAGIATGAVSFGSGKFLGDVVDTAFSGTRKGFDGNFLSRAGKGFLTEGVVEELPQSMQEQMFTNVGSRRPLWENVPEAGAEGMMAGGLTGGVFGLRRRQQLQNGEATSLLDDAAPSGPAPQPGQQNLDLGYNPEGDIGLRGLRNPYDAAGYVSGVEQGMQTTIDPIGGQQDLFGGDIAPDTYVPPSPAANAGLPSGEQTPGAFSSEITPVGAARQAFMDAGGSKGAWTTFVSKNNLADAEPSAILAALEERANNPKVSKVDAWVAAIDSVVQLSPEAKQAAPVTAAAPEAAPQVEEDPAKWNTKELVRRTVEESPNIAVATDGTFAWQSIADFINQTYGRNIKKGSVMHAIKTLQSENPVWGPKMEAQAAPESVEEENQQAIAELTGNTGSTLANAESIDEATMYDAGLRRSGGDKVVGQAAPLEFIDPDETYRDVYDMTLVEQMSQGKSEEQAVKLAEKKAKAARKSAEKNNQKLAEQDAQEIDNESSRQGKNVSTQAEETTDDAAPQAEQPGDAGVQGSEPATAEGEQTEEVSMARAVTAAPKEGWVAAAQKVQGGGKRRIVRKANTDLRANATNNDELGVERSTKGASTPTTVTSIKKALKGWFFTEGQLNRTTTIVQSWDELPTDVRERVEASDKSKNPSNTQAFVLEGHAYMVADNIDKGEERSVFMHEVGAHVGLTEEEEDLAAKRVYSWSRAAAGTVERRVYDATMKRMQDAGETSNSELVAYATEEAVNAGVSPTVVKIASRQGGRVQDFINALAKVFMAKVKEALGIVGKPFTAQDLVDLTYGAARIATVIGGKDYSGSSEINRPLWYSRAAAYIEQKAPKASLTAQKWMENLNAWVKAGNIKADELAWSGVENWLKAQTGVVSRDELVNFFNEGGVQIEEKVLGDYGKYGYIVREADYNGTTMYEVVDTGSSKVVTAYETREAAEESAQYSNEAYGGRQRKADTHYSNYTEPGAKDGSYREILLKLPKGDGTRLRKGLEYRQMDDGTWNLWDRDEWVFRKGFPSKTILEMRAAEDPMLTIHGEPAKHRAPHYGNENENILATARINERTDADGNRVLYIEEIQSDWAQDLRKKGAKGSVELALQYNNMTRAEFDSMDKADQEFAIQEAANAVGVNNAPFIGKTEQWAGLILKRLMRYAADNGFDKVAWSTGEQQFKRWGSERVSWKKGEKESYTERVAEQYIEPYKGGFVRTDGAGNRLSETVFKTYDAAYDNYLKDFDAVQVPGFYVSATEQTGGNIDGQNIEEMARARGELIEKNGRFVKTKEDLRKILRNVMRRENNEQQIDVMTDKLWDRMQKEPEGDFMPRRDGMRGFYGDEQGRAPDGKPSWLANALKSLPAEIRPKLETVGVKMRQADSGPAAAWNFMDQAQNQPGFTVDKTLANRPMPLFSKRANATKSIIDAMPQQAQEPIRYAADAAKDAAQRGLYFSIFTDDLIDAVNTHLPSARKWYDAFTAKIVEMTKREKRVGDIAEGLNNLSYSNRRAFDAAMELGRDMRIDQKWAYQPTWMEPVEVDPEYARRYNALKQSSPEAVKLLDEALRYGKETIGDVRAILDDIVDETYPGDTDKAQKQRKMLAAKLPQVNGPYMPLRRVGSHLFYGKSQAYLDAVANEDTKALEEMQQDENHYIFKMFDSYAEANAYARQNGSKYAESAAKAKEQFFNEADSMPFRYFEKIKLMTEGMDSDAAKKVINLVNELYLTSLADTSARKSELRAKGVAGMSPDDMFRAFVSKGVADAHYIAALKNGREVSKSFNAMRQEARKSRDPAAANAMNELAARYAKSFEHDPAPLINRLLKVNSLWMLLTKPAYYLFNATQPALMTHPFLANKFGYAKSAQAMQKAYSDYLSLKNVLKPGEVDLSKLPQDVAKAIEDLVEKGKIDITLSQELGDFLQSSKTKPGRVMDWAGQKLRGAVQKGEMMNRVVTGISAYRMEKARTGSHEKAVEYAAKVIDKTQGNYAGFNAPRLMNQTSAMRLITQFRKFQLIQMTFLVNAVREIAKGRTLEEKWALSAMLRYTLAHHAVLAGAMGLPLMNVASMVFAAMGDDDEPKDLELSLREWIGDDTTANLLLKGVLANPLTNVDISKNVGMSGAFQLTGGEFDLTSRDGLAKTVLGLLGPTSGMAGQGVDAMAAMNRGDYYKGLEALMPSGIKSAMKSLREATQGQTNTRGDTLVDPEEINLLQSSLKALGFKSADDSVRQLVRGKKFEFEKFFNDRTSELKNQYAKAYKDGDGEKLQELRESWMKMQESKRSYGFTVQPLSKLLKAPSEQAKRERETIGGVQFNKASRPFVEKFAGGE